MLFKVLLAGMCSLCLVGTATLASAHEFIVKPDKTQAAKGESVGVQAQAAHVFMISEEAACGQGGPPFGRPRHDRRASSAADLERHD